MKIYVSGSLAYDRIMGFPGKFEEHILPEKIHMINVSFVVNGLIERLGGTAGNIAHSLYLLGEKATILAAVGKDFDAYETRLRQYRLPLAGIRQISEVLTAGAYITTDLANNQITGFNPGAMNYPAFNGFAPTKDEESLAIIAPGNLEDMLAYSRAYKEHNIPYIFDPGQQIIALSAEDMVEILTGSQLLISNDYELQMIQKATALSQEEIQARTGSVIVTLGDEGSRVLNNGHETCIPAAKAREVVDPTGCGDAYRAGLIKGLILNRDLETAARMGAVMASFNVECKGTQEHDCSLEQFQDRYQKNYGAALAL
ncbi:MAG: carbohydrate kinase family protein [Desulfobacterales bacterium]|jgi:adenosine kinase